MSELIIVGASTRAAAMSARRAGWTPWCADLFADADLERIATVQRVPFEDYPAGLLDALKVAPAGPVMYTGALENRPDLIAKIDRPLWGNSAEVLRAIRAPEQWAECLQARRLPCPATAHEPRSAGRWLLKPRRGAGGFGIHGYAGQVFNPRTHFLQEWVEGVPCSAVFCAKDGQATYLNMTEQLIGTPWLNASGFHYAGSIGPVPLSSQGAQRWRDLGMALAEQFHLRGLFGVDAVMRDGVPWPVEINPRYSASVEVLERSMKVPLLHWHRQTFEANTLTPGPSPGGSGEKTGKAILFARTTFHFPADGPWLDAMKGHANPDETEYADIPHAGEIIEQGRPVLTIFASADTIDACRARLEEKARALDRRLWC